MREWTRDTQARVIDAASFGFINLLQCRARAGSHSEAEMRDYIDRWKEASLQDFYTIPESFPDPELPERGSFRHPSPLSGGCPHNDRVHLDFFPATTGWKAPVMFMLHGVMSVSDVGYRLWAKKLNSLGWSAAFFHLPYHYGRTPPRSLSGEMALTANLIRTSEGIRQAVVELRWIMRAMKKKGAPHIGLWGTSYGGWIASLLCCLESCLNTAWLLEPIVDIDWAIWESPATRTVQRQLRQRGISRETVAQHVRLVCPSHHRPVLDNQKIILMAGLFDRIAHPDTIRSLASHWNIAHYAEIRQGHVGYQLMPKSLNLARQVMPDLFSNYR